MSRAKEKALKAAKQARGSGAFLPFRLDVLRSQALSKLSPYACKLLLDFASQWQLGRNGDASAAFEKILRARGWRSKTTLHKALKELCDSGLIVQTRQGSLHKCSLYALGWLAIDECGGKLDIQPNQRPARLLARPTQADGKQFEFAQSATCTEANEKGRFKSTMCTGRMSRTPFRSATCTYRACFRVSYGPPCGHLYRFTISIPESIGSAGRAAQERQRRRKRRMANTLTVVEKEGKSRERKMAELGLSPLVANTNTARTFGKGTFGQLDLGESIDVMREKVDKVKAGDLSDVEATLIAQATTLDAVLTNWQGGPR